jgi:5,10-methylene-tetrahydrofolate dehydrogenase/methenyl tetrahydrofolate cyclohydrolase
MKIKASEEVGMKVSHIDLPNTTTEPQVRKRNTERERERQLKRGN